MPEVPSNHDETAAARHAARWGLVLFTLYVALYAGFIYLAVAQPATFAASALGGVNVAVAYGLGLIAAAIVLAVVYVRLCRR